MHFCDSKSPIKEANVFLSLSLLGPVPFLLTLFLAILQDFFFLLWLRVFFIFARTEKSFWYVPPPVDSTFIQLSVKFSCFSSFS